MPYTFGPELQQAALEPGLVVAHLRGSTDEQAAADAGLQAQRAVVATPLRAAHRYAVEVDASPLQDQVESLAAPSRIPLHEPAPPPQDQPPAPLGSLTKREQEVLGHLVAGWTYAEIARALYVSEKTVSVHMSNLLRKTGTSSRREVSALASRLGHI